MRPLLLILPLFAGACATTKPQLYTAQELGRVAQSCGYSLGELVQEQDEPRILFVFTLAQMTQTDQNCVYRWARPRKLHVAFMAVELAK
jgi:hypothetical protein